MSLDSRLRGNDEFGGIAIQMSRASARAVQSDPDNPVLTASDLAALKLATSK
jgi:hypothetical protein